MDCSQVTQVLNDISEFFCGEKHVHFSETSNGLSIEFPPEILPAAETPMSSRRAKPQTSSSQNIFSRVFGSAPKFDLGTTEELYNQWTTNRSNDRLAKEFMPSLEAAFNNPPAFSGLKDPISFTALAVCVITTVPESHWKHREKSIRNLYNHSGKTRQLAIRTALSDKDPKLKALKKKLPKIKGPIGSPMGFLSKKLQ